MPHVTGLGRNTQKPDCLSFPAYTAPEAARYLRLSEPTVRRWAVRRASVFLSFLDLVDLWQQACVRQPPRFTECLPVVVWDGCGIPSRFYPSYPGCDSARRVIAIDPRIRFGRPIILRAGVTTRAISERIKAKETNVKIAADYGLTGEEVMEALLFECAG